MSTTALFVELLVIGLQALVWIALLISCVFGTDWLVLIGSAFEKASLVETSIVASFAYLAGMIIEQISDSLVEKWEKRIAQTTEHMPIRKMWMMKMSIYSYLGKEVEEMNYMRSRRRILRASFPNLLLITMSVIALIWARVPITNDSKIGLTIVVGITGLLVIGLAGFVYWRITVGYFLTTQRAYDAVVRAKSEKQLTEQKVGSEANQQEYKNTGSST